MKKMTLVLLVFTILFSSIPVYASESTTVRNANFMQAMEIINEMVSIAMLHDAQQNQAEIASRSSTSSSVYQQIDHLENQLLNLGVDILTGDELQPYTEVQQTTAQIASAYPRPETNDYIHYYGMLYDTIYGETAYCLIAAPISHIDDTPNHSAIQSETASVHEQFIEDMGAVISIFAEKILGTLVTIPKFIDIFPYELFGLIENDKQTAT